ncbi:MAG: hypothetical protein WCJ61_14400 [Paludibacter sp.]
MLLLILSLLLLTVIIFVSIYFHRKYQIIEPEITILIESGCCGAHAICQHDTLLNSSNKITYYDDDKLDDLADTSPVNFSNEQLKLLLDVFLSINDNDMAGWLRSLQIRNIQLPVELREQALMIVSERRTN